MKEYKGMYYDPSKKRDDDFINKIHNEFSKLVLEFESFICPMVYSSRDIVQIKAWGLLENRGDIIDAE